MCCTSYTQVQHALHIHTGTPLFNNTESKSAHILSKYISDRRRSHLTHPVCPYKIMAPSWMRLTAVQTCRRTERRHKQTPSGEHIQRASSALLTVTLKTDNVWTTKQPRGILETVLFNVLKPFPFPKPARYGRLCFAKWQFVTGSEKSCKIWFRHHSQVCPHPAHHQSHLRILTRQRTGQTLQWLWFRRVCPD